MAKRSSMDFKVIILAVSLIIVATVGSAFATYLIFASTTDQGVSLPTFFGTRRSVDSDLGHTFNAGDFTINLNPDSRHRYMRAEIVFEVQNRIDISALERNLPGIRDRIIRALRGQIPGDFDAMDEHDYWSRKIVQEVNSIFPQEIVRNAFFINLVLQ